MKINWTVRFNNPVFWRNIAIAVSAPIFAHFGLNWEQMTTWSALGDLFVQAAGNPVVIVAIIVSVWNAINDPTTAGDSDSTQALTYTTPKKGE